MSPYLIDLIGCLSLGLIFGFAVGVLVGDHYGTKDTERRWSEAVGRKSDDHYPW